MTGKILWTICLMFFLIFLGQIFLHYRSTTQSSGRVAGINVDLPEIKNEPLTIPPEPIANSTPNIYAKAAILIDVPSAYVMYEDNADTRVPMASTTKVMTAMVVLENYPEKLKDIITITYPMIAVEGSDIELTTGENITVENLLKGLLIKSGNDTANAIAVYFGGKDSFVKEMNEKTKLLGLNNTQFNDPAGLDDSGYSTARELAYLSAYAMRNQTFKEIVQTPLTSISSADGTITHELKSSNRMLRSEEEFYYPFAVGIKTGFTNEAGHCLIAAAEKDNRLILSVILNTHENTLTASAKESRKLLEWGFANWNWK